MFKQELFNKICTTTCTYDELRSFTNKIDEQEFCLDNPFEKYYSLDRILQAIKKYQTKEITDDFLSSWAMAYNWIIMAGFENQEYVGEEKEREIKENAMDSISDLLDALSFFDEKEFDKDEFDLNNYIEMFTTLDEIYYSSSEWEIISAPEKYYEDDDEERWELLVNHRKKKYLKYQLGIYLDDNEENEKSLAEKNIDKRVRGLKSKRYEEMPYYNREENR